MSASVSLRVQLFGGFRDHFPAGELTLQVPIGITVKDLRQRLAEALGSDGARALLSRSAIGNDSEILQETCVIEGAQTLALLPPVCGG